MNKIILTGASIIALSTAGAAFAQATVPAECIGATANCSVIDQDGTSLSGTVSQTGTGNSVTVTQGTP